MSRRSSSRRGCLKKSSRVEKQPLVFYDTVVIDEEPLVPTLSPVLCNHHMPNLELVSPSVLADKWVNRIIVKQN